jgi:hypothetical protein
MIILLLPRAVLAESYTVGAGESLDISMGVLTHANNSTTIIKY